MTASGFTYKGTDPGAAPMNVVLVDKSMSLVPSVRSREILVPGRPGSYDFGSELGPRQIELQLISGDNANVAGTDAAVAALADLFDPTEGAGQLIFDTTTDRYWLAKVVSDPVVEYLPSAGRLRLTMRCSDPFAYSTTQYVVQGGSAVITGATAYRQIPALGLTWNLVKNGGFIAPVGSEWALHANASRIVDATSVSGYALRLIATGGTQQSIQVVPVEAGKAYSIAAQVKGDGTNYAYLIAYWLDAAGIIIGGPNISAVQTAAAWAEVTLLNLVAPGNARSISLRSGNDTAGVMFYTAVRVRQAATIAAWTAADQQTLGNQGISIQEAATNLLTNGDIETALSGTVNGFNDTFADLNAWTLGGAVTVAANVVTMPAASAMLGGHSEWWTWAAGSQLRFQWATGATMIWWMRYIDANNFIQVTADGTSLYIRKVLAGVGTNYSTQAAALTNATWYWFDVSTDATGATWTAKLFTDSPAGTKSATQVGATSTTTITDTALLTGQMRIGNTGAQTLVGGAFSNVCTVTIPAPPGWAVASGAGTPAFCVSKTTKFSGTYSLSVYNNAASATGYWSQSWTAGALAYTASGRVKYSNVAGTNGIYMSMDAGNTNSGIKAGTRDWGVEISPNVTQTAGAKTKIIVIQLASGTVWFDLLGLTQTAYDVLNADPSGLAYTTTSRVATSVTEALPAGFNLADFAMILTYRPDHAATAGFGAQRVICNLQVSGTTHIYMSVTGGTGSLSLVKNRGGVSSSASDAGATAHAAGDTLRLGLIVSPTTGLTLLVAKNGGAIVSYNLASAEALLPITGTPTLYLGLYGGAADQQIDGTIGIDRILGAGLTSAQVQAAMAA